MARALERRENGLDGAEVRVLFAVVHLKLDALSKKFNELVVFRGFLRFSHGTVG